MVDKLQDTDGLGMEWNQTQEIGLFVVIMGVLLLLFLLLIIIES